MADGKKEQKFRLRDMIVESVDLVDRPANQKRFLLFKREEDMGANVQGEGLTTAPPEDSATVQVPEADVESGATPTAKDEGGAPAEPDTAAGDPGNEGSDASATAGDNADDAAGDAGAETVGKMAEAHAALLSEKMEAIGKLASDIAQNAPSMDLKDLRAKLSQLESMGWKVGEVAEVVNVMKRDATEKAGEIPQGVKDAVKKVLREAVERLMSVNNALRVATVTQDKMSAPLPDPVYREMRSILTMVKGVLQKYPAPKAAGEAGEGEAEETDKAADAAPEVEAVGNETALELAKQTAALTLPAPVRDAVAERVREATEVLMSAMGAVEKAPVTEAQTASPMPAEIADAIGKAAAAMEETLQKYPAPSAKSEGILAALHEHFNAIENIVKQVVGDEPVVVKAEPPAQDNANAELLKRLDGIAESVKKNADAIAQVIGTPKPSNALEDAGGTGETEPGKVQKNAGVEWGNDLAAEIEPEPADAE